MNEVPLVPFLFRKVTSAAWLLHVHQPKDFPDYTVRSCMRVALSLEGRGGIELTPAEWKLLEEVQKWPFTNADDEFVAAWRKRGFGTLTYLRAFKGEVR